MTPADLHRADLGDRVAATVAAGGLDVDHTEGDVAQGDAEFVE